jgi:hypothetical protein
MRFAVVNMNMEVQKGLPSSMAYHARLYPKMAVLGPSHHSQEALPRLMRRMLAIMSQVFFVMKISRGLSIICFSENYKTIYYEQIRLVSSTSFSRTLALFRSSKRAA